MLTKCILQIITSANAVLPTKHQGLPRHMSWKVQTDFLFLESVNRSCGLVNFSHLVLIITSRILTYMSLNIHLSCILFSQFYIYKRLLCRTCYTLITCASVKVFIQYKIIFHLNKWLHIAVRNLFIILTWIPFDSFKV